MLHCKRAMMCLPYVLSYPYLYRLRAQARLNRTSKEDGSSIDKPSKHLRSYLNRFIFNGHIKTSKTKSASDPPPPPMPYNNTPPSGGPVPVLLDPAVLPSAPPLTRGVQGFGIGAQSPYAKDEMHLSPIRSHNDDDDDFDDDEEEDVYQYTQYDDYNGQYRYNQSPIASPKRTYSVPHDISPVRSVGGVGDGGGGVGETKEYENYDGCFREVTTIPVRRLTKKKSSYIAPSKVSYRPPSNTRGERESFSSISDNGSVDDDDGDIQGDGNNGGGDENAMPIINCTHNTPTMKNVAVNFHLHMQSSSSNNDPRTPSPPPSTGLNHRPKSFAEKKSVYENLIQQQQQQQQYNSRLKKHASYQGMFITAHIFICI